MDGFTRTTRGRSIGWPRGELVASYTYSSDIHGNLTRVTDVSGNTVTFGYGTLQSPAPQPAHHEHPGRR